MARMGTVLYLLSQADVSLHCPVTMTGAVAYYAPHRYAYKITAFLGLVPLAVNLSWGDTWADAKA